MNDSTHPVPGAPLGATPEALVEQYLGFVTAIAKKILRGLPSFVELGDLEGFGQIGLIEASRRFDATRGVQFKTFAYYRIRGAIYDGIRKMAWFDKDPDYDVTYQAAANEILTEDADSRSSAQGSATLEDDIQGTRETILRLAGARLLSLDHESMGDIAGDSADPEREAELADAARIVHECIEQLDEKERNVVKDYYFGHLTLEEAGAKMGLSKSWTSRVHARALKNLASLVEKRGLDGVT
ncbi:MAG: sigma-70 family RNA polymerase sigma factor [Candidatus Eisenbacteria bacterium]|uniref:Sigma-70 family RNA polymerase sigma factor n=1 Tax=Eiseniibacteriota bacterium TaxID=2212470 RepID=A0A956NC25_UNCEI|nr:sigma-70 family RNA polymerase sigma factor [Candidatus Eisenbacteria bacterium]MCB9463945.1 sigma-70 family RNA polymerase sigma factor [Candidatus Eisenbacteria bacterium]